MCNARHLFPPLLLRHAQLYMVSGRHWLQAAAAAAAALRPKSNMGRGEQQERNGFSQVRNWVDISLYGWLARQKATTSKHHHHRRRLPLSPSYAKAHHFFSFLPATSALTLKKRAWSKAVLAKMDWGRKGRRPLAAEKGKEIWQQLAASVARWCIHKSTQFMITEKPFFSFFHL